MRFHEKKTPKKMKIKDASAEFKRFIVDRSHQILTTDLSRFVKCPMNEILTVIENNSDKLLKNYDTCFSIKLDKYKILISILYTSMISLGSPVSMNRILCLFKRKNWSDKKRESRITIGAFISTMLKFLQPNDKSNYETLADEDYEPKTNFEFEKTYKNDIDIIYEKQEKFIDSLLDIEGFKGYQESENEEKKIVNYELCDVKGILEDLFVKMKFSESILLESFKTEMGLSCLNKKNYKKQITFYCLKRAFKVNNTLFPDKYIMELLELENNKHNYNLCKFIEKYHQNM